MATRTYSVGLAFLLVILCGCRDSGRAGFTQFELAAAEGPAYEIGFTAGCGLPAGRTQVYDPRTGIYHIHFGPSESIGSFGSGLFKRSGFEIAKVHGPTTKPVTFRLTGVPANFGCFGDALSLNVGRTTPDAFRLDGKSTPLIADPLALDPVDATLVQSVRDADGVTITLTEKGAALLVPGALISFRLDHGW
jgi:hypothetical protein